MLKIALRNILRNKRRTALTGLSIAVAVTAIIFIWSLIMGVNKTTFDNYVKSNSGHIRILDKEYFKKETMLPLSYNVSDYSSIQKIAEENKEVILSTPRIKFGVLLTNNGKNKPTLGVGIDPIKEEQIIDLSHKILEGRAIAPGTAEVNIGISLAKELGLKLGDTLTVLTQTAYGSIGAMNLKIIGIYSFGVESIDNKIFYIPLSAAQRLLDMDGRATEIFLLIKKPEIAPQVATQITAKIESLYAGKYVARPWQDQGGFAMLLNLSKYLYGFIYLMVLFLASFTILNTMLISVLERTREIGMMKALGMRSRQVVMLIVLEAFLIGLFASILGAGGGGVVSYFFSIKGINIQANSNDAPFPNFYRAEFNWSYVLTGLLFGIVFATLAAILPARKAAKLEPVEAMRE